MSELKVNKVTPATGTQVELEATTVLVDGTMRAGTINGPDTTTGVALQYNGSTKLATTTSGVQVTGTINATNFTGNGSGLTGVVAAGVGGASSAGALSLISDSGNVGTAGNDIVFTTGNLVRGRVERATGNLIVDTTTLVVDAQNDRVGIGKASPATTLDVNGTVTATTVNCTGTFTAGSFSPTELSATSVTATTGTITNIGSTGTSSLATLNVSGNANFNSGTLFVNSSQNRVGVGTASPSSAFEVSGDAAITDGTTRMILTNASGISRIGTSTNHPLVVRTNNTDRITFPADAAGIQFPASPVLSSNANTLDAYAEGTYTFGNLDFGGSTLLGAYTLSSTTTDRMLQWTRIGNMILFECKIGVASRSNTGTGNLRLTFQNGTGTAPPNAIGYATCVYGGLVSSTHSNVYVQWSTDRFLFFVSRGVTNTASPPLVVTDTNIFAASGTFTPFFHFSGVARVV